MILITVFNPETHEVLSHKTVSHTDMVLIAIPGGTAALVGKWVPYDELVDETGYEFFLKPMEQVNDHTV